MEVRGGVQAGEGGEGGEADIYCHCQWWYSGSDAAQRDLEVDTGRVNLASGLQTWSQHQYGTCSEHQVTLQVGGVGGSRGSSSAQPVPPASSRGP